MVKKIRNKNKKAKRSIVPKWDLTPMTKKRQALLEKQAELKRRTPMGVAKTNSEMDLSDLELMRRKGRGREWLAY